jgi:Spy/CpxP family protein refolding chaperone
MKNKTLALLLVLAMVLVGTLPAVVGARGMGGNGMGGNGGGFGVMASGLMGPGLRGLNGLDLTDEQKTQVASILDAYQEEMTAAVDLLLDAKEALADAIWACDDAVDVGAAYDAVAEAEKEVVLLQAAINCDVMGILTEEQIAALEDHRAERIERMRERREAVQTTLDEWIDSYLSI